MITRETDYAIRLVQYLADRYDDVPLIPITEISAHMQIPYSHLRLVGTKLSGAGIITSRRGHSGGYRLNRKPSEISLYDVIHIIDSQSLVINLCLHQESACQRSKLCKVHVCLGDIQDNLIESFAKITFDQIAQQS